jgi:chromosome segregation ATPase
MSEEILNTIEQEKKELEEIRVLRRKAGDDLKAAQDRVADARKDVAEVIREIERQQARLDGELKAHSEELLTIFARKNDAMRAESEANHQLGRVKNDYAETVKLLKTELANKKERISAEVQVLVDGKTEKENDLLAVQKELQKAIDSRKAEDEIFNAKKTAFDSLCKEESEINAKIEVNRRALFALLAEIEDAESKTGKTKEALSEAEKELAAVRKTISDSNNELTALNAEKDGLILLKLTIAEKQNELDSKERYIRHKYDQAGLKF